MNKKILILIIGSLLVFLAVIVLVIQLMMSGNEQEDQPEIASNTTPTASLELSPVVSDQQTVAMFPADESINVATDSAVSITFDKPYSMDQLTVEVVPNSEFAYAINGNQLSIEFLESLERSTRYTVTVGTGSEDTYTLLAIQSFVTEGPEPSPIQYGTRDTIEADQQYILENNPDIFLANLLPYETTMFSLSEELAVNSGERAQSTFLVNVKAGSSIASVRPAVQRWLTSQGLSQEQINQLTFEYTED